jgi:MYXO-CTERM domain-containing protein
MSSGGTAGDDEPSAGDAGTGGKGATGGKGGTGGTGGKGGKGGSSNSHAGEGGEAGETNVGGASHGPPKHDSGCGCSVPGAPSSNASFASLAAMLLAAHLRRSGSRRKERARDSK